MLYVLILYSYNKEAGGKKMLRKFKKKKIHLQYCIIFIKKKSVEEADMHGSNLCCSRVNCISKH